MSARQTPVILQHETSECGLACLAMILGAQGATIDVRGLRRQVHVDLSGVSLNKLIELARANGLQPRAMRAEPDHLHRMQLPAILHWSFNHFVVLVEVSAAGFVVHDPAVGRRVLSARELSDCFTGVVLECAPTPDIDRSDQRDRITLWQLVRQIPMDGRHLFLIGAASLLLQLLMLIPPMYGKIVIDDLIHTGQTNIIVQVGLAFALAHVSIAVFRLYRNYIGQTLGMQFDQTLYETVYQHLFTLPYSYFTKRSSGDVLAKLESVREIIRLGLHKIVVVLVDAFMTFILIGVMLYFEWRLALIIVGVFLLQSIYRAFFLHAIRTRENGVIAHKAQERTAVLENVQGVKSIRSGGFETPRGQVWRGRLLRWLNTEVENQRLEYWQEFGAYILGEFDRILMFIVGGYLIMESDYDLTVGALYAMMTYRGLFVERVTEVIDFLLQLHLSRVHLDRVADVLLEAPEGDYTSDLLAPQVEGRIEVEGAAFGYGSEREAVLKGVDLDVAPGEFVVISGPSGEGKTTLLYLLAGLFKPNSGDVRYDGRSIFELGLRGIRGSIGLVSQDDSLFTGTIAENIAGFDSPFDMEQVQDAAIQAGVDKEIEAFPLQYNTLIGGHALGMSAGQRQRILLARALYQQPTILLLDEVSANLDQGNETRMIQVLRGLRCTKIIASHSASMADSADRVVRMRAGVVTA